MKLKEVIPPHMAWIDDLSKKLIQAYSDNQTVTPVVIIGKHAICGSHRIHAAKKVFHPDTDISKLGWIVLQEKDILSNMERYKLSFQDKMKILSKMYSLKHGKTSYVSLLEEIGWLLPLNAKEALKDQDGFNDKSSSSKETVR